MILYLYNFILYDSESVMILYQNLKMNISMTLILKIRQIFLLHRILFIAKIKKIFKEFQRNYES